jgi:hypothetical protein
MANASPPTTTTEAPSTTTTGAPPPPETTTEAPPPPDTTTEAPPPPDTTTEAPPPPDTTTEAPPPPDTTTEAPPPATTSEAPVETTTEAAGASTTPAPSESTTASGDGPSFKSVEVKIDPDDGLDHHANSVQVANDAKLTLTWETSNATGVHIDDLGDFDASGSEEIPTVDKTYTLTARDDNGAESQPWVLDIHTHDPADVVSPHVDVATGVATIVSFQATKDDAPVLQAAVGDEIVFTLDVADGAESAKIAGQDAELAPGEESGQQRATLTLTVTADMDGHFVAESIAEGKTADSKTVSIEILPTTTTAATTTTTTETPTTTTTAAPTTTTTAAPTTTSTQATTTSSTTTTQTPSTTTTQAPSTTTTEGGLGSAAWGADKYEHGQTIDMNVDAPGVADGTTVYFLIEFNEDDGGWTPLQSAEGKVSGGKVRAPVTLQHPPNAAERSAAARGRSLPLPLHRLARAIRQRPAPGHDDRRSAVVSKAASAAPAGRGRS